MILEEICIQLGHFNLTPFASNFSYFYLCGFKLDPDPQHWSYLKQPGQPAE